MCSAKGLPTARRKETKAMNESEIKDEQIITDVSQFSQAALAEHDDVKGEE